MKNLYIVGGTMGVGKTTVCQRLRDMLPNSVFLDGDWCWDAHPFQVTQETKRMVLDNICYLLNNFIHCTAYDNIVFCWVLHEQCIIDDVLNGIDNKNCKIKLISLLCDEKSLRARLEKDVEQGARTPDIIERSISRIPLYGKLTTIKIDTTNKCPQAIAEDIAKL